MRSTFLSAAAAATVPFVFFFAEVPLTEARSSRAKRDAPWVPSDPRAFQVNLGYDTVGRYVASIGMVRRPIQRLRLPHCSLKSLTDLRFILFRAAPMPTLAISTSSFPLPRLTPVSPRLDARPVPPKWVKHQCTSLSYSPSHPLLSISKVRHIKIVFRISCPRSYTKREHRRREHVRFPNTRVLRSQRDR